MAEACQLKVSGVVAVAEELLVSHKEAPWPSMGVREGGLFRV